MDAGHDKAGYSVARDPEAFARGHAQPFGKLRAGCNPRWNRLFHVYDAIKLGIPFSKIHELTKIDIWFLRQIEDMILTEKEVEKYTLETIPRDLLFEAKQKGYADRQVAHLLKCLESEVYKKRNALGIKRVYKLVDTCAGEFPAKTPYYYSTFEEENESVRSDRKKIVVLGSGPNRIGQGIEFDYCCVHGVLAAKELGYETIMINCNPETVSTDFDTADKQGRLEGSRTDGTRGYRSARRGATKGGYP